MNGLIPLLSQSLAIAVMGYLVARAMLELAYRWRQRKRRKTSC